VVQNSVLGSRCTVGNEAKVQDVRAKGGTTIWGKAASKSD